MLLLPDQTYEEASREFLTVAKLCDDFLAQYRIRPEFFCRYRERLAALKCQGFMSAPACRTSSSSGSVYFLERQSLKLRTRLCQTLRSWVDSLATQHIPGWMRLSGSRLIHRSAKNSFVIFQIAAHKK
ncbi:hypothetical protein J6590_101478 [Homalodisca vitripennis]|nr:hypothetical protein J6590_057896 [Homalodisca vitripennis]KAG8314051.1 hypothetical protein J6590_101478 [Homalodisca vitripennis]